MKEFSTLSNGDMLKISLSDIKEKSKENFKVN